jgi:predicted dehydrogenase
MEVLIHHLGTVRFLIGPVQVVAAHTARISPEVIGEDMALIGLKAVNGAIGIITGNFSAAGFSPLPGDRLELIGEKASILFENYELPLIGDKKESIRFNLQQAYQQSYDNAIAHFVWAQYNSEPFETDRLDNLKTLRLVEDAYRLAGI